MKNILIITVLLIQINNLLAQTVNLNVVFTESSEINLSNEIKKLVYGVDLIGSVELYNEKSFVEIFVVDNENNEYLIQEFFYPLYSPGTYDITHCEEIDFMNAISLKYLKIELFNAEVELIQMNYCTSINAQMRLEALPTQVVQGLKIDQLNTKLSNEGFLWRAELNEYNNNYNSRTRRSTYEGSSYGFQYYNRGIFSSQSPQTIKKDKQKITAHPVPEFDWRNKHGAMNENSPYFDNNFDTYWVNGVGVVTCDQGNGWMTKIHCQRGNYGAPWDRCPNGCYLFSVTNSVEAKMNLYYNQHLDYDLSEQEIMECSPYSSSTCYYGGDPEKTAKYIRDFGVVNESCLPYINDTCSCSIKCTSPESKVKIEEYQSYTYDEEGLKELLITQGPMSTVFGSHAMCLVGYGIIREGMIIDAGNGYTPFTVEAGNPYIEETYWILKNTRTAGDNHNGYVYLISSSDYNNMGHIRYFPGLVEDLLNPNLTPQILDEDNDGYYNWGIGPKPANCPPCPAEPDSDDSDAAFGPFDENYYKTVNWNNFNSDNTTEFYFQNRYWYNEYIRHNTTILSDTLFIKDKSFIATNSSLTINSGAVLAIQNGELITGGEITINGNLHINGDADIKGTMNFYDNSEFIIRSNSLVNLNNGQIVLHDNAKLIIEDYATVENINISGSGEIILMGNNITLQNGVFNIPVQIDKNVKIKGNTTFYTVSIAQGIQIEGGADGTTLNLQEACAIEPGVTFTNLTNNGDGGVFYTLDEPFSIEQVHFINTNCKLISDSADVHVQNCTFNGSALYLGQMHMRASSCTVKNSSFTNTLAQEVLRIDAFKSFVISDNVFENNMGTAIAIYKSGESSLRGKLIENNLIHSNQKRGTAKGILIYASVADIHNNTIFNNDYGIALYHNSNVSIRGDNHSIGNEIFQLIYNNVYNQIFAGNNSFPWRFELNVIRENNSPHPRLYCTSKLIPPIHIAKNCWGDNFDPKNDLYPFELFIYEPVWDCGLNPGTTSSFEPRIAYEEAIALLNENQSEAALVEFKNIVSTWPQSMFAAEAMKAMLESTLDLQALQTYFATNTHIQQSEELKKLATYLTAECFIKEGAYQPALSIYEGIIANPPTMEDSIYALIDAGRVLYLMEQEGDKTPVSFKYQYLIPETYDAYAQNRKVLLDKLHGTAEGNQNQEAIEPDILESLIQDDFKLYPNPVSDVLNIEFTAKAYGNAALTIYNTMGQVVYRTEAMIKDKNSIFNINTVELKQGVYVLQISINDAQTMSHRFVINR
jgi:hypothetical protein